MLAELMDMMAEGGKQVAANVGALAMEIGSDIGAEAQRLGTQGSAELAAALFSQSNAYTPYGAGQNPVGNDNAGVDLRPSAPELTAEAPAIAVPEIAAPVMEMDGRSM